jgi:hypothetical protein
MPYQMITPEMGSHKSYPKVRIAAKETKTLCPVSLVARRTDLAQRNILAAVDLLGS